MSLAVFRTLSCLRPAKLVIVASAAVLGVAALHDTAFAQPSPPDAQEQPAAPRDAVGGGSSAAPTDGESDDGAGAVDKSEGNAREDTADERAMQSEPPATDSAAAEASGETNEAAKAEQPTSQSAQSDTKEPARAGEATEAASQQESAPENREPSSGVAAPQSEPASTETTDPKTLTVATWPGAYGEVQRDVVIAGFEAARSIAVEVIARKEKDPIDLSAEPGANFPDAAEFSAGEIDAGCNSGQLVKLAEGDSQLFAPSIARDFMPGSLKPCGIGAFAWSHLLAVNPNAFEKAPPKSLADAFDTKRFPGKRAFIKKPRFLMEAALMADGVKRDEVYRLLETEAGRQRAFAKLDGVGDDIVWFDDAKAAMQALVKGDAAVGQSFSGRAFFSAARGWPVEIIWDGQIYAMTYWAIPAKSPKQKLARAFLEFATQPQQLAAVAQRFPYGPTRTSAITLTERHAVVGLDLKGFLPTAPGNMGNALAADEGWWSENQAALDTAFAEWQARRAAQANEKSD